MESALAAHKDALASAEAQAADARRLAELYEAQVAEVTAQLAAARQGLPTAPGTPPPEGGPRPAVDPDKVRRCQRVGRGRAAGGSGPALITAFGLSTAGEVSR